MKWLISAGLVLVLLMVPRIQADEDLVEAPGPDESLEEEDVKEEDIYDMYTNTQIDVCKNVADGVHLPVVGDCSKFIECENNTIKKMGSCIDIAMSNPDACTNATECDFRYDPVLQVCTNKKVQCLPTCKSFQLSSFCYDNTCTKYVLCYYGKPVLRECQDGLQYNNVTDRCDFPEYVDCVANDCSATFQPQDIIYLPSKASCSKYFVCSNGHPWEQECAPGLAYNPEGKYCDFAKNVECTIDAAARNIIPYSRSPMRRADIKCPQSGVHFFAHKSRRDAYYYCVDGSGVTLDCTPGLFYDPKVQECRRPEYIGF